MGGRFCSLDQRHSECESALAEIMSFRPQNRMSSPKIEKFLSPKSSEDQKKKVFTAIWGSIRPKYAGFICAIRAGRPFFV